MKLTPTMTGWLVGTVAAILVAGLPFLQAITGSGTYYGHYNPQSVPSIPGAPVEEGGVNLVFFGYGSCTRTCPAQLTNLLALQERITNEPIRFVYVDLGAGDDRITPVSHSIEQWGDLFSGYSPKTFRETQRLTRAYGGFVAKEANADSPLDALNHDGRLHVVTDDNVRVLEYLSPALDIDAVLTDLRLLMTNT